MTSKRTNRDALDRLTIALVEDILTATDEDVLIEARQEHPVPPVAAEAIRALIEKATAQAAKSRLNAARSAVANDRGRPAYGVKFDTNEARRCVEQILARDTQLTLAARKEHASSDNDVKSLLDDFIELGITSALDEI